MSTHPTPGPRRPARFSFTAVALAIAMAGALLLACEESLARADAALVALFAQLPR